MRTLATLSASTRPDRRVRQRGSCAIADLNPSTPILPPDPALALSPPARPHGRRYTHTTGTPSSPSTTNGCTVSYATHAWYSSTCMCCSWW